MMMIYLCSLGTAQYFTYLLLIPFTYDEHMHPASAQGWNTVMKENMVADKATIFLDLIVSFTELYS